MVEEIVEDINVDLDSDNIAVRKMHIMELFGKEGKLMTTCDGSGWSGFEKREDGIYRVNFSRGHRNREGEYIEEQKLTVEEFKKKITDHIEEHGLQFPLPKHKY